MARSIKLVTDTAAIVAHSASLPVPLRLRSVTIANFGGGASVVVRTGGASGTVVLMLATPEGDTYEWSGDAHLANGIHVTITGISTAITVEWEV